MTEPNAYAADPNEILGRSVDELEVSVRTAGLMQDLGIQTIGDLVKLTERDILSAKAGTKLVVNELVELLGELGLTLGMKP